MGETTATVTYSVPLNNAGGPCRTPTADSRLPSRAQTTSDLQVKTKNRSPGGRIISPSPLALPIKNAVTCEQKRLGSPMQKPMCSPTRSRSYHSSVISDVSTEKL